MLCNITFEEEVVSVVSQTPVGGQKLPWKKCGCYRLRITYTGL